MCYANNTCDMTITMKCILPSCLDSAYHGDTKNTVTTILKSRILAGHSLPVHGSSVHLCMLHSVQLFK